MEQIQLYLATGSWWLYALLAIAAFGIATISYARTDPPISPGLRWLLTTLRTVGIAVLLIALFEPILKSILSEEQEPPIVLAVDASASLQIADGGVLRDSLGKLALDELQDRFGDRARVVAFDESVDGELDVDSLVFDGARTNVSAPIRWSANLRQQDRPGVVVVISDGNSNTGDNPVYTASRSGLGVYAVAIGDTVPPTDASLRTILTSGLAVIDEPTPISVSIAAKGLDGERAIVEFLEEGRVFATDTVILPRNGLQTSVSTLWTPSVEGLRKVQARLRTSLDEFTLSNNLVSDFVEVRSSKRTVVVYAGAPSPDLTFIQSVIARDQNVNVVVTVQKQGSSFYDPPPSPQVLSEAEACVFVGFPTATTPRNVLEPIARACKNGLSLLFIASKDVDYTKLAPFEDVIPFSVATTRPSEFLVTPEVLPAATTDPLMKITGTDRDVDIWNTLPPVYRTETFVTPRPGARTLATMRIQNVPIEEPLIMRREQGEARSLAILAYGIYRWKLLGEGPALSRGEKPIPVFDRFLENGVSWLSVNNNDRRVRIRSTRQFYGAGETVAFTANVLDASLVAVDDAEVSVKIKLVDGTTQSLVLSNNGNGRYAGTAGSLPSGSYSYLGSALRDDTPMGSDNGRFEVGELGIEEAASYTNIALLRAMADRTGGVVSTPVNLSEMIEAIEADPRLRTRAVTTNNETTLWHLPWPLLIALTAFSVEWALRKRASLA